MSNVIKLPSGASVTLRDVKTLKHKDRRAITIAAGDDTLSKVERGLNMKDALLSLLIEEWSLDLLPPSVRPDSLGELDLADYDALSEEGEKAMAVLYPNKDTDDVNSPLDNSNV
jgi:hypothetical protein